MIWFQKFFHLNKLIKRRTVNRENNQIIAPAKEKSFTYVNDFEQNEKSTEKSENSHVVEKIWRIFAQTGLSLIQKYKIVI